MIAVSMFLALSLAQTPEELVRQLGHEEASRREEAAAALEALGQEALPALEQGAKSEDPEVRERAADVLATVRTTLMVGMKLDPDRLARIRSAIDVRRSPSDSSAYDALLLYSGGDGAPDLADIPYLLAILWDPGQCDGEAEGLSRVQYLRARALQALRHFPITDENEEHLIAILRAVLPTGERPSSEAEELYWGALFSEAAQVTQPAIRESIRKQTLAALLVLAKSSQTETRIRVARALAAWNDEDIVPVIALLLEDSDPQVQEWTAQCLEERDPAPFREALGRVVKTSKDGWIRYSAARALARCGEKLGVDALFDAMGAGNHEAYIGALRWLSSGVGMPEETVKGGTETWREWWKENRDRVQWDPDREMFVTE